MSRVEHITFDRVLETVYLAGLYLDRLAYGPCPLFRKLYKALF